MSTHTQTSHTHDEDVERALLGAVLGSPDPTAWDSVLAIIGTPLAFYLRDHRIIALGASGASREGHLVNLLTVSDYLGGMKFGDAVVQLREMAGEKWRKPTDEVTDYDDSALAQIGGMAAVSAFEWSPLPLAKLATIVAGHYRQRQLIASLTEAIEQLKAPTGAKRAPEIVETVVTNVLSQTSTGGTAYIHEGMDQALALHDRRRDGQVSRCAVSGIDSLDALCRIRPGQVWVLAAPQKTGKTSLLLHYIRATAERYGPNSVAVVSREMDNREIGIVMGARRIELPREVVDDGRMTLGQREQYEHERDQVKALRIAIRDTPGDCSMDEVYGWASARHRMHPLAMLAIDYLQLLTGSKSGQREYDRITEASAKAKQLARSLDIPVLIISQLSREGRKQGRSASGQLSESNPEPQLSDLRGSGSIEQDADGVLFLWRPDPNANLVKAMVKANRAGPCGSADLEWCPRQGQRFKEAAHAKTDRQPAFSRMNSKPTNHEAIF